MEIMAVKTGDSVTEYFAFGSGRVPFVVLPGMSLTSVMKRAEAVKAQYAMLADEYRIYVFDRKRDLKEGCSIEDMADDTATAMKMLGLEGAVVYGVSQGGMIAQTLAWKYPELAEKLILVSTIARNTELSGSVLAEWKRLADGKDVIRLNKAVFEKVYAPQTIEANRDAFEFLQKEGTKEEMKRFSVLTQACIDFDGYERLKDITCKRCVIGGDEDRVLDSDAVRDLAEGLGVEPEIVCGYGHAVYDEAPDFIKRIYELLKRM